LGSVTSTFLGTLYTDRQWRVVQQELEQLSRNNSITGILRRQEEALLGIANAFHREAPDPAKIAAIQKARETNERSLAAQLEAAEQEFRARIAKITAQLPEAAKAAEKTPEASPIAQAAAHHQDSPQRRSVQGRDVLVADRVVLADRSPDHGSTSRGDALVHGGQRHLQEEGLREQTNSARILWASRVARQGLLPLLSWQVWPRIGVITSPARLQFGLQFTGRAAPFSRVRASWVTCGANVREP
jgi:hypothetical protein